ncbi:MAG: NADH-quinone oxidoreductase subunit C [Chloroflexota bacterium]|nr:NADH-quinone oxidoreductase subunit C [Chloroflexota bacterium]
MNVSQIVEVLRKNFPDETIEVRHVPMADTFVKIEADNLHATVTLLMERFDVCHLSTITGEDTGGAIALLYHFWDGQGLTLCTSLSREAPHIPTLTDLIPGADFYEREVHEMLVLQRDFTDHFV